MSITGIFLLSMTKNVKQQSQLKGIITCKSTAVADSKAQISMDNNSLFLSHTKITHSNANRIIFPKYRQHNTTPLQRAQDISHHKTVHMRSTKPHLHANMFSIDMLISIAGNVGRYHYYCLYEQTQSHVNFVLHKYYFSRSGNFS